MRDSFPKHLISIVAVVLAVAVAVSVVAIVVFGGPGFLKTTTKASDYYLVSDGYTVELSAGSSNVNVAPSSNGTTYVVAAVSSSVDQNPSVSIISSHLGDTVNFTVKTPQLSGLAGFHSCTTTLYLPSVPFADNINITLTNGNIAVSAPFTSTNLKMQTSNGNIAFNGGQATNIFAMTSNGNVEIASASQINVSATTHNGNIMVQFFYVDYTGDTQLLTQNGNINVRVDPTSRIAVTAATSFGSIVFESGLQYSGPASSPSAFTGYIGNGATGSATLHAVTGTGNIYFGPSGGISLPA